MKIADSIVSVRMPKGLLDEVREVAAQQHYMDLSEAMRSIIRRRIEQEQISKEQLIRGLKDILEDLDNEAEA